ncbi:hypothetical protein Pelo_13080 [Pelomyxa schiedti]|nr:hypothetical protein Pelo_13080 [Pelomyxa schiedti]
MDATAHTCYQCGKTASLRCSTCKGAWYCDSDCQLAHWRYHRTHCHPATPPTCPAAPAASAHGSASTLDAQLPRSPTSLPAQAPAGSSSLATTPSTGAAVAATAAVAPPPCESSGRPPSTSAVVVAREPACRGARVAGGLDASDQFVALAASSNERCGRCSAARPATRDGQLRRYMWSLWTAAEPPGAAATWVRLLFYPSKSRADEEPCTALTAWVSPWLLGVVGKVVISDEPEGVLCWLGPSRCVLYDAKDECQLSLDRESWCGYGRGNAVKPFLWDDLWIVHDETAFDRKSLFNGKWFCGWGFSQEGALTFNIADLSEPSPSTTEATFYLPSAFADNSTTVIANSSIPNRAVILCCSELTKTLEFTEIDLPASYKAKSIVVLSTTESDISYFRKVQMWSEPQAIALKRKNSGCDEENAFAVRLYVEAGGCFSDAVLLVDSGGRATILAGEVSGLTQVNASLFYRQSSLQTPRRTKQPTAARPHHPDRGLPPATDTTATATATATATTTTTTTTTTTGAGAAAPPKQEREHASQPHAPPQLQQQQPQAPRGPARVPAPAAAGPRGGIPGRRRGRGRGRRRRRRRGRRGRGVRGQRDTGEAAAEHEPRRGGVHSQRGQREDREAVAVALALAGVPADSRAGPDSRSPGGSAAPAASVRAAAAAGAGTGTDTTDTNGAASPAHSYARHAGFVAEKADGTLTGTHPGFLPTISGIVVVFV